MYCERLDPAFISLRLEIRGAASRRDCCNHSYWRWSDSDISGGDSRCDDDCFADRGSDILSTEITCTVLILRERSHDSISYACMAESWDDSKQEKRRREMHGCESLKNELQKRWKSSPTWQRHYNKEKHDLDVACLDTKYAPTGYIGLAR